MSRMTLPEGAMGYTRMGARKITRGEKTYSVQSIRQIQETLLCLCRRTLVPVGSVVHRFPVSTLKNVLFGPCGILLLFTSIIMLNINDFFQFLFDCPEYADRFAL
jgi:hypothetical protein